MHDLQHGDPPPSRIQRPAAGEYASLYEPFIALVPDGDVIDTLTGDIDVLLRMLAVTPPERGVFRYAAGKWSVNDVLGHIIDCERIYTYRALRFARGDRTPLPGFDQNAYVPASGASERSLADLADEIGHVRGATVAFWRSLDPAVTTRSGPSSGVEISVRSLAYVTAGHARHHAQLLRDRYGVG